jgi:hypothetical protein
VWPSCPALQAVVVERMEGTVAEGDVAVIRGELRAARRALAHRGRAATAFESRRSAASRDVTRDVRVPARPPLGAGATAGEHRRLERELLGALSSRDPIAAVAALARDPSRPPGLAACLEKADGDGLRMAALLSGRLRFERLLRGSVEAERWFDDDARGFTAAFARYHREVPPRAFFPVEEARAFASWRKGNFRGPARS